MFVENEKHGVEEDVEVRQDPLTESHRSPLGRHVAVPHEIRREPQRDVEFTSGQSQPVDRLVLCESVVEPHAFLLERIVERNCGRAGFAGARNEAQTHFDLIGHLGLDPSSQSESAAVPCLDIVILPIVILISQPQIPAEFLVPDPLRDGLGPGRERGVLFLLNGFPV